MTSPSVSPVEPGAGSGVRERLTEAAAEALWSNTADRVLAEGLVPASEPSDWADDARAVLAAVLGLIAQALDDERADSDEPAWHVDPEINSAWQWGMRRAAALVRSWAADGAR